MPSKKGAQYGVTCAHDSSVCMHVCTLVCDVTSSLWMLFVTSSPPSQLHAFHNTCCRQHFGCRWIVVWERRKNKERDQENVLKVNSIRDETWRFANQWHRWWFVDINVTLKYLRKDFSYHCHNTFMSITGAIPYTGSYYLNNAQFWILELFFPPSGMY